MLEILGLLGRGGMGAVYQARQIGLDRLVAIKILPPEYGLDPQFVERFTREAKTLARLSHPHIVSVYDFGQADDLLYIIMEHVNGTTLRHLMQTRKLSPAEALVIIPQLCDALQYAHDQGIVHRDIKPENILLDHKGMVKVVDFGLAKIAVGNDDEHSPHLTQSRQVLGTPRYMAPEQLYGGHEVDHRSDIYALGVVFYEMLTGEVPTGRFESPSKRVTVDVRIDEIVLRALERDVERRYQHASDLKTDVESMAECSRNSIQEKTVLQPVDTAGADTEQESLEAIPPIVTLQSQANRLSWGRWLRRGGVTLVILLVGIALWRGPSFGRSSLLLAAQQGDQGGVGFWLNLGFSTETASNDGMTPLLWAAWKGETAVVRMLLARGANIERISVKGETALMKAAYHGHVDIVQILRDQGARLDRADEDGQTALIRAAGLQHPAVVEALLRQGTNPAASLELADKDGLTPLMFAALAGHDSIVRMLLKFGADPGSRSRRGLTPLMLAAANQRAAVVRTLLPISDIAAKGNLGETALNVALKAGDEGLIDMLLAAGAADEGSLWLWRGYRLGQQKKYAAAIPLLEKAIIAAREATSPWAFGIGGWHYETLFPSSLSLLLLADCQQHAGDSVKAVETLRLAVESLPRDVPFMQKSNSNNGSFRLSLYTLRLKTVAEQLQKPGVVWNLYHEERRTESRGFGSSSHRESGPITVDTLFQ